jgi:hypothetical protein
MLLLDILFLYLVADCLFVLALAFEKIFYKIFGTFRFFK